jgi:uncharacterized protein YraI
MLKNKLIEEILLMKQKPLFQVLALALLVLLTTAISLAQVGMVVAVQQEVWLRVGPGTEWRRVDNLAVGTTIALDGRDVSGLWVRGITQNGQVGWTAARYLGLSSDTVFSLPLIDREAPMGLSAPAAGSVPAQPQAAAPATTENTNQPAPTAPISGGIVAAASSNVNMRSGPGTGYARVGGLNAGEQFNIDGRDGNLTWVRGINGQGVVGWVSVNYINLSYDQVAALPVVDPNSPFGLAAPAGAPQTAEVPSAPVPAPIAGNTNISGFGYGGHVRGLDDVSVNYMRIAGMSWAKYQVRYTQGDNPAAIAGLIQDAHAKGFRILLGVVGWPYQLGNGGYNDAYAGYVGGLAALGADAIEVWNEPNLDREWPFGQINAASYTQLLAASFNAIKANNGNTYVISAALAPTGAESAFPGAVVNDNSYLAGMVAAGALNYMDCVGAHYNEGIVPPTWNSGDPRSEYYTRYYNGMVNTYWNIIGGRRPLCFTELGYLTPQGYGALPGNFGWAANVTVAQQAEWLDQVVNMARNSGRVRILIIWNINFLEYGADPMGGYAIIRPDGSCPACHALGN